MSIVPLLWSIGERRCQAEFLKAGSAAVKAWAPDAKVMLHLARGGDNGLYRWWFDNITALGVPFDLIGASYYGYWHGSLGDLQANLNDVSSRYGKDVVVVETAYPFTLDAPDLSPEWRLASIPCVALDAPNGVLYDFAFTFRHLTREAARAPPCSRRSP